MCDFKSQLCNANKAELKSIVSFVTDEGAILTKQSKRKREPGVVKDELVFARIESQCGFGEVVTAEGLQFQYDFTKCYPVVIHTCISQMCQR